ncbi:MAG TPA: DUF6624 domain-containing protein [Pirellulales bacterium]|nr:DUF6624 domain-containing protein [Pirellulales bacterium]
MKESRIALYCSLLAAAFSIQPATGAEQEASPAPAVERRDLRKQLLARDQEVRQKTIDWMKENKVSFEDLPDDFLKQPVVQEEMRVDRENREWLKTIVERHGWPGKTLVGVDGTHAAWLLAQHADHEFRRACLRRMQERPVGEVAKVDVAYLTDRVRLAEGKPQIYGTQLEIRDGRWQPCKVEDPENLDRRRQEIGLPPIAEYLKDAEEVYGPPSKKAESK